MEKPLGLGSITVVLNGTGIGVTSSSEAFHAYCDMHFDKIIAFAQDGLFDMTQGSFVAHFDDLGNYSKCEKHLYLTHPKV
jgi:hypothetical protein